MTDKLPVYLIVTTYDPGNDSRYSLLRQCVQSWKDNLVYPNLHWIITDDGSPHYEKMIADIGHILYEMPHVYFFNTGRKGVGFAKNNALREAFKHTSLVLLTEDDWYLPEKLDLLPHVQLMMDHLEIGMIRFGFLGGAMEAEYTDYGYPLTYWKLKPASGFYVYSGQVSLRSFYFYQKIGWHAESCDAGAEEENMCWRYNALESAPSILWPAQYGSTLNAGPFKNIGIGNSVNHVQPIG